MVCEILFGNKENNIIEKLKKSGSMRGLLLVSYFYLYEIYGKTETAGVKNILLIGIAGVLIVNLFYVPVRLLWSKEIGFELKLVFTLVVVIGISYYSTVAREISLYGVYGKAISIIASSLAVTFITGIVMKNLKVHCQEKWNYKKHIIISRNYDKMEGHDFEYFCANLLRKQGFGQVEVTQGSGDYGIDIIAYKYGIKFGIQCKRYQGNVGWHAVEEAYSGARYYNCHKAVVLTNSSFTQQAIDGAEKLGVELWGRERIEEMV